MADGTCKVDGCDIPVPCPGGARGMCVKHYKRWKKHGDPLKVFPHGYRGKTDEERFWEKVDRHGPIPAHRPDLGPCWVWTPPSRNDAGYGVFSLAATPEQPGRKPRLIGAHKFSYELVHGPVGDGLELDHLCRNPSCVNPAHLEPVTHRVNTLRGTSPAAEHARQETCSEGHEYDRLATRGNGRVSRRCSVCDNRRNRERPPSLSGPMVGCACGCGATFPQKLNGRIRRWLKGHHVRGEAA